MAQLGEKVVFNFDSKALSFYLSFLFSSLRSTFYLRVFFTILFHLFSHFYIHYLKFDIYSFIIECCSRIEFI